MSKAPYGLRAYRTVTELARPFVPFVLMERTRRNKEDRTRLGERRGEASRVRPAGPVIWVHGASVGECLSLLPLVEELVTREVSVLVTSGTVTSANVLARRLPEGATHQFLPLDIPLYARRFIDHWRPDLVLFAESEIWPNLIFEASSRGIPIVQVNARMSERSFRRWARIPALARHVFSRFDVSLAQSQQDAERLVRLGATRVAVTGNLKYDAMPPPASPVMVSGLEALIGARPVWLAASTHPGEESLVIDAHRLIAKTFPDLLTIIVPRHPERGREVAAMVMRAGMGASLRSQGLLPDSTTDIYVADTIGETGLFYRIAPLVFVGGSLVPHGGQNPIEPAKLGAALLHGPHVHNFEEVYGSIDAADGAMLVDDSDDLAMAVTMLLTDTALLRERARRAVDAVQGVGGALQKTVAEIAPYLLKMHLGG
jgi:3-deoxy-D-manno-octulosonic-acid transferase